jgi:intracellular sulfur oxidation DsrE/DsrF family protein
MKYIQSTFNLSESQKEKLIHGKKNGEAVTIQIARGQIGGSDLLYLTPRQIEKLNKMKTSVRITLSKTQIKAQTGGFLGAIIPFIRAALPTVGKILGTLALSGAAGAISGATNQAVKKKMSGEGISLHIPKNEMQLIIESTDKLEQVDIVPKGTTEMIKGQMSEQKGGFIGTLLATLASILLPSLLGGKGLLRAGHGKGLTRAGEKKV